MSERVGAGNPSHAQVAPAGILVKADAATKHPSCIRWDEEVIAAHDLLRGTRAPISEPKTPFNRERIDEEQAEEQPSPVDPSELATRLAQLQEGGDSQQQQELQQQKQLQQGQQFKEKRKQHYNEFLQSRMRLQQGDLEDQDEDE